MNYKGNSIFKGKFFVLLAALAFIILPLCVGTYWQSILVLICFYGFCAVAWNLICGYAGTMSLGHSVYMGIGGYASTILLETKGVSPWIGMIIGALIAMIIGVIISYPTFRLKGPYFTLASIAITELVGTFVMNSEYLGPIPLKGGSGWSLTWTGGGAGMYEFDGKLGYYYIALIMLVIGVAITWKMSRSKLGYYLVAIRSDDDAAKSLGINITKYKLIAMAISCFMIALAGTFYAEYFRYIGPDRIFSYDLAVQIALIALIGGQGTVMGPVIGSIVLVPLSEMLSARFASTMSGLNLFLYGVIMMLVVYFMPHGLCEHVVHVLQKVEEKIFGSRGKKKAESK
ncbi:MAG: branched-chain amino acid ABC transporter permease [Agathobaculum sp.]|jgi:branched-chain amino acid transport system permease protein|uniref:branched-chain amino acid ABC transporter permease n=1 Tax=Agathobaculum sp. TaxID=2048138 RepID=UPI003D922F5E